MTPTDQGVRILVRDALVEALDSAARWRANVAERFPDDRRNPRSCRALAAAAAYTKKLDPDASETVARFARFLDATGWETPELYSDTEAVLGRFFFDHGTAEPNSDDFDRLLDSFYLAKLEAAWQWHDEQGVERPNELGELVAEEEREGRLRVPRHFPVHLREAFCGWVDEGCPDVARLEVNYEESEEAAGRFLNRFLGCFDSLPNATCDELEVPRGASYGLAAKELLARRASGGQMVYVRWSESGSYLEWDDEALRNGGDHG